MSDMEIYQQLTSPHLGFRVAGSSPAKQAFAWQAQEALFPREWRTSVDE